MKGWGSYSAEPKTEWLKDGRKMKLLEQVTYTDPAAKVWIAPAGWIVDGASIPRAFWSVIGGPLEGQYRNASVFHDVACDQKIAAMESGAPNVLQRDAMQRRQRDQGEDNVLRGLQFWAVLGSWLCCDANVRRRCKTEIGSRTLINVGHRAD